MHQRAVCIASVVLACIALFSSTRLAQAQYQPPSEQLSIKGTSASTWTHGEEEIIAVQGPVKIELDRATLTAGRAVIWLKPNGPGEHPAQKAQIALLDDAKVVQKVAMRSGGKLFVTGEIKGTIRLDVDDRIDRDDSGSALYQAADALRPAPVAPPASQPEAAPPATEPASAPASAPSTESTTAPATEPATAPALPPSTESTTAPATAPAEKPATAPAEKPSTEPNENPATVPASGPALPAETQPATEPALLPPPPDLSPQQTVVPSPAVAPLPFVRQPGQLPHPTSRPAEIIPVYFESKQLETTETGDGTVAAVLTGDVMLVQRRPNGDTIELRSNRAVLFTPLKSLKELQQSDRVRQLQDAVSAAYLEGDVRIAFTPANPKAGEQRLQAERVYYEFATDRAVLTDAVIHTLDPVKNIPMIVRARTVRQLAMGEYTADKAQLTTSYFAVPSYAINADRLYVRSDEVPGPVGGERIYFRATDATFRSFDVPVFWLPAMSGSMTDNGGPLRDIGTGNRNGFGYEALSEWGLFESLGVPPPHDLDLAYRLDYFTERGPGIGLDGAYGGGLLTDYTRQPWDFAGDFKSYLVDDKGDDTLGGERALARVNEGETIRGRVIWEHEHFFPDDWQVQLRAGYVSDATFREEWFLREWEEELPLDTSVYVKHQQQSEAFTLLVEGDPSHVVTTADLAQEQFEVEHLPEIGYRRIGDSWVDDKVTTFSDNTFDGLHFQRSHTPLVDQGYFPPVVTPGLPSLGVTGTTGRTVYRANFREEADLPFTAGAFRVMPYAMGIYSEYSDSPKGGDKARLMVGGGAKVTTEFWKVDPNAESDLFDIHQIRHVIEPELNLFTSVENINQRDVFIYEEPVDEVNDVSAASLALHQRWETKRGGPGQWRNVDAFTFNAEIDGFLNKPNPALLAPKNFRGLFFPSAPETSIARDAINSDATWRLSDSTVMIADMSYNLDKRELATAAIGVLVHRGDNVNYYIENRYVDLLNSNITSVHLDYEISSKYSVSLDQSFDFSQGKSVVSSVTFIRRFDTFLVAVTAYRDEVEGQNGFNFSLVPIGLGNGIGTGAFQNAFTR